MIKGIVRHHSKDHGCGCWAYFYFATGRAPVAVTAPEMPFRRRFARLGLIAYLNKLPHPDPQVPANEVNLLAGPSSTARTAQFVMVCRMRRRPPLPKVWPRSHPNFLRVWELQTTRPGKVIGKLKAEFE